MSLIFISYRRTDSKHATSRIYDRLRAEFGKGNVFKDVDSIPIGTDFRAVLRKVLGQCRVALVMIGPDWVTTVDAHGKRRLMDPTDVVRMELEATLARGIPVVPVLLDGAQPPGPEDLPESLQPICYRHASAVGDDPHFDDDDVARLVRGVRNLLQPQRAASKPPKPRGEARVEAEPASREEADGREVHSETQLQLIGGRLVSGTAWFLLGLQAFLFGLLGLVGVWTFLFNRPAISADGGVWIVLCLVLLAATGTLNFVYAQGQPFRRRVAAAFCSAGIMIVLLILRGAMMFHSSAEGMPVTIGGMVVASVLEVALTVWFVLGRPRHRGRSTR